MEKKKVLGGERVWMMGRMLVLQEHRKQKGRMEEDVLREVTSGQITCVSWVMVRFCGGIGSLRNVLSRKIILYGSLFRKITEILGVNQVQMEWKSVDWMRSPGSEVQVPSCELRVCQLYFVIWARHLISHSPYHKMEVTIITGSWWQRDEMIFYRNLADGSHITHLLSFNVHAPLRW